MKQTQRRSIEVHAERALLRAWIQKALDFIASLPAKEKRPAGKAPVKKPSTSKASLEKAGAKKTTRSAKG